MAWMTINLALDLLAILIGATENAYNTIKNAPDGNWPPAVEQPANEPATQNTLPTPPQQQATEPTPNADALLVEAKNLLQGIVATGGREWVTGTLLPKFGVAKLSDVPADKLPQLVETAKQKQQEAGQ